MAVVLATARLLRTTPQASISGVELLGVEAEFSIDPENDALDYWGLS